MIRGSKQLTDFEANYEALESLVKTLESKDLTLMESLEVYEKAMKMGAACSQALEHARQRVQALAEVQGISAQAQESSDDDM